MPKGTTYGKGSFKEVQLLVDGQLAGFASPFPVLFTGANVPLIWRSAHNVYQLTPRYLLTYYLRPVPAYGAFDQPTYKVDLTPFVPLLADGNNHTVTINVGSSEPDQAILGNWWVSGNIQVCFLPRSKLFETVVLSPQRSRWSLIPRTYLRKGVLQNISLLTGQPLV